VEMQKIAKVVFFAEVWLVAAMVGATFVSARLLPFAVLTAALFWLARGLVYRRLSVRTPLDLPVIGLVIMALVSVWITAWPEITHPQVLRLLAGIGLCYALVNWVLASSQPAARLRLAADGVAIGALGLALFAFFSVEWEGLTKLPFIPSAFYTRFPAVVADTANPNVMAGSLVILMPVVLAWLLFGWRCLNWLERGLTLIALAGLFPVLLLTQSRGALLAAGVALLGVMVMRWRAGWLLVALGVVGAAGLVYWVGVTPLINLLLASVTLGGMEGRMEVWSRAIYMLQDFAFSGVGMGAYGRVADLLYPFFRYEPGKVQHAHNLLLQIGVDLGFPGLVCWLAAWMIVSATGWQVYRQGRRVADGMMTALGAGVVCSQAALLAHGMLDAVTWGMVRPAPLVWALWGLAIAASLAAQTKISPSGSPSLAPPAEDDGHVGLAES